MATRTETHLIDDVDKTTTKNVETYRIGLGSDWYDIDLAPKNTGPITEIEKFIRTYGRKVKPVQQKTVKPTKNTPAGRVDKIRTWARANGHGVSDKGRISNAVIEAYEAAQ